MRARNLLLALGLAMFIDGVVRAGPGVWWPDLLPPRNLADMEELIGPALIAVWWVLWKFEQEESRSDAEDVKEREYGKDSDSSQGLPRD